MECVPSQDGAPPFSNAVAADVISEDLGAGPDELFSSISPEPAASASLGQVYQATLAQDERLVAVKVMNADSVPEGPSEFVLQHALQTCSTDLWPSPFTISFCCLHVCTYFSILH